MFDRFSVAQPHIQLTCVAVVLNTGGAVHAFADLGASGMDLGWISGYVNRVRQTFDRFSVDVGWIRVDSGGSWVGVGVDLGWIGTWVDLGWIWDGFQVM